MLCGITALQLMHMLIGVPCFCVSSVCFLAPQTRPRALSLSASVGILSDLREDAGCYSNSGIRCCSQDPGLRDWPVNSPKVSKVHKSEVCTARF